MPDSRSGGQEVRLSVGGAVGHTVRGGWVNSVGQGKGVIGVATPFTGAGGGEVEDEVETSGVRLARQTASLMALLGTRGNRENLQGVAGRRAGVSVEEDV